MEEVEALSSRRNGGNDAAQRTWLKNAPPIGAKYSGGSRPRAGDRIEVYKQFILDCYEHGKFKSSDQKEPTVLQNDAGALPSHLSTIGNSLLSNNGSQCFLNQNASQASDNSFNAFDVPTSSISANERTMGFATFSSQIEPHTASINNPGTPFPHDIFNFTSISPVGLQSMLPPTLPANSFDDPFGNDLLIPIIAPVQGNNHTRAGAYQPPSLSYAPSNSMDSTGIFASTNTSSKSDNSTFYLASAAHQHGYSVGIMGQQHGPFVPYPAISCTALGARTPSSTSGPYGYVAAPTGSVSSAFGNIGSSSQSKQSTSFDFLEDALKQQLR